MSGCFCIPGIPALEGFVPGEGSVKKAVPAGAGDFSAFLEAYLKNAGLFAVPYLFPVTKSCGASCGSTESPENAPLPCPLSTQSSVSLSCPGAASLEAEEVQDPLQEFSTLLSDALEMVESFTVTLRLGEGDVTVSGARDTHGVFSFSIGGKKEALVEFFTMLFENLKAWIVGNSEEKPQCARLQCGWSSPENGQSGAAVSAVEVTGVPVQESMDEPEVVLENASSPVTENELPTQGTAPSLVAEGESLVQDVPSEGQDEAFAEAPEASSRKHPGFSQQGDSATSPETATSFEEKAATPVLGMKKDTAKDSTTSSEEGMTPSFAPAKNTEGTMPQDVRVSVTSPKEVAQVFEEVLKVASETRGRKEVVLRLEPEHLGSIVVRLEEREGQIRCFWEVADPGTRELLLKYLPALEAHCNALGMPFANFFGDSRNAYAFSNFRWARASERDRDDEVPFEDPEVSRVNLLV
ncbi:flagellar hook-length control protein FliK [Candidatus Caldatribacterium sp. SIUC1]|uniref:flagellar hook-length control protein FliK n=1 Tax=Candidatus Caldatribacterium sp. SIUC1 TaxID=3418365 RepID=UPI003F68F610